MCIRFRKRVVHLFNFLRRYTVLVIYVSLAFYLLSFLSLMAYLFVPSKPFGNLFFVLLIVFLSAGVFFSGLANLIDLFRKLK